MVPNQFFRTTAGTAEESDLLRSLLGPVLGVSPADVPDLGLLLVGPMARGRGGVAAMKVLDRRTAGDLAKLLIFMRRHHARDLAAGDDDRQHLVRGRRTSTSAEFVDATGVVKGDDIRIAGVKVGTVKGVEIVDRTHALVTFTVEESVAR